jgi:hypothetical protein
LRLWRRRKLSTLDVNLTLNVRVRDRGKVQLRDPGAGRISKKVSARRG